MKRKIFNLFLIVLMVMVFSPIVHAETTKPEGASWLVDQGENHVWYKIEGTTLTIGGSGAMPNWKSSDTGENSYTTAPWFGENIMSIIIAENDNVTKIGEYAFVSCESLVSIKLAQSVETIGTGAFRGCSKLNTIEFNDTLKYIDPGAFNGCAFTSLTFPEGLKRIGGMAFQYNDKLTKIVLPSSLEEIQMSAFWMNDVNALKEITSYRKDALTLGASVFKNVSIDKLIIPMVSKENYSSWSIYKEEKVSYLYTVIFDTNGGNEIKSVMVEQNNKLVKPTNPTKENYVFDGWCVDEKLSEQFNFNTDITKDTTLYAKWREVESFTYKFINGNNQELTIDDIKSFVLKVDGDYSLFESITIGKLDLIKNEDYTVTEGSTVITFTDKGIAKLNTLSKGEYEILVKYSNDKEVKGKLTIKQIVTPEPEIENPKTGDNYTTYLITEIISLISIIGISFYTRKKLVK